MLPRRATHNRQATLTCPHSNIQPTPLVAANSTLRVIRSSLADILTTSLQHIRGEITLVSDIASPLNHLCDRRLRLPITVCFVEPLCPQTVPDGVLSDMSDQIGFEEGAVYIVLHLRSTDPDDNTFHWGLYHHYQPTEDDALGYKYHVQNIGDNWMTDHSATSGILKSMALVVVVRIIRNILTANYVSQFQQLVRADHTNVNIIPSMPCRIWLFRALQRLQHAGLLRCNDLNALEQEVRKIGRDERLSACQANLSTLVRSVPPLCVLDKYCS